ncbi:hypothetical protein EMIHUDRAFT_235489 [Emiliania huxleyi CCMP1516]|uniref:Uncharacterized protein n=2 Tax=Emiliania huxleyi TaxID=2903 RepID=A0A0D3JVU0_EMIH1|nr:hypothetical protein EMIHUDRAFT_235489 [Emiliania huxleyi CCMP1516]EOD27625.1 hypothetical protein EMIHUDRAFT_235489 [Emiliania huxleyi CCMP1516]|eukprot:XP_005780054.1 hypothetical protein EMIHUDRAFT_235489 [Emiliania huxleyi CCMP1516]
MLGGTNSTWLSPGKHPVSALFEFAQAVGARGDGGGARREVGAGRGGARPAAHAVSPAASACCVRRELSMRGRAALNAPARPIICGGPGAIVAATAVAAAASVLSPRATPAPPEELEDGELPE